MSQDTQAIARLLQTLLRQGRGKVGAPWLVLGCVLLGGYLLAEPWLEDRYAVDLPGIHTPGSTTAQQPETSQPAPRDKPSATPDTTVASADTVDQLIRSDREEYVSPAGLRYTRGSQQGHRLRHLMAHAHDEPGRPVHGVFDADGASAVVALVDEAYRLALAGKKAEQRTEGDRTVYEVDLGRRIGYIGGQSGARRNHPAARRVQLVLIDERLITAYPVTP